MNSGAGRMTMRVFRQKKICIFNDPIIVFLRDTINPMAVHYYHVLVRERTAESGLSRAQGSAFFISPGMTIINDCMQVE
jgi:hypothetical protein